MSTAVNTATAADTTTLVVPAARARALLGHAGKPIARQTVFSLGVRREIEVQMIAGRFFVTRESIDAYRARHGLDASRA